MFVRRNLALLFLFACTGGTGERVPPNVLLITVDTLRPDAVGFISGRNDTLAIDALAKEGFRFRAAVAPVPLTFPSHAALHTGVLPRRLGLRDNGQLLGTSPATLAEVFAKRGYTTAAFVSGYPLASEFGLDRGFAHYDDRLNDDAEPERHANATTASTIAWMRTASSPWFVWVHYYDPHFPYIGSYAHEVATVDRAIATLRSSLGNANTLTIFAADHGESLGEHGEGTHGFFVYDSTILVPLVFHWPGHIEPRESRTAARLIDVAPTILDLLELPPLEGIDGVSLRATLRDEPQTIPAAYVETYQPWTSYGWSPLHAVRDGGWKFIAAPRPELYDLRTDPAEAHNVFDVGRASARPSRGRRAEARPALRLEKTLRSILALPRITAAQTADAEALAKLRSLGYIGAGAGSSEPPQRGLRDPKDGAALRERLTRGDLALRAHNAAEALPHFEAVLREDPENRFALIRSATALLSLDRAEEAVSRLETALRLDPQRGEVRALLAVAWTKRGTALGLSKKFNEAVDAFARAVELEPHDPRWLARLAFAQHAAGRRDAAAQSLLRLANMTGEEKFAYAGALGILLAQEGRHEEARAWLAKSRPEEADFADARFELAALEAARGNRESAQRALRDALSAAPALRARAERDPRLAALLQ